LDRNERMFYKLFVEQECFSQNIFNLVYAILLLSMSGCAVSYIDETSGQWKVIGFVKMDLPTVITKSSNVKVNVNSVGLLLHSTPHQNSLSLGYSQTSTIYMGNPQGVFSVDESQSTVCEVTPQGDIE
jgi:hypothetical protein